MYVVHLGVVLALLAASSSCYDTFNTLERDELVELNGTRLHPWLRPAWYRLQLEVRATEAVYNGSVRVGVVCLESTSLVSLHAHGALRVHHVNVTNEQGEEVEITRQSRNASDDTLSLTLAKDIQRGTEFQLHVVFSGQIRDARDDFLVGGIYMEKIRAYPDTNRYFVATANSPTFARQVFPCFDEPSFKAPIELSLARPKNMTALSVMPKKSTEPSEIEGYEWDHFPPTPSISTFSFNFFIHNFNTQMQMNVSTKHGHNISVNLHYQNEYSVIDKAEVNASMLTSIINYMEDYMGIDYPLSKLDIAKIGHRPYVRGSSLGLIMDTKLELTVRNPRLTEELVNQWVNHMVSPKWWDAFNVTDMVGSFLAQDIFVMLNAEYPFGAKDRYSIFDVYSHHMTIRKTWKPFGSNSGEWFLYMLNSALGGETVKKGISSLYREKLYSTFSEEEFWDAVDRQVRTDGALNAPLTVKKLVESWLGPQAPNFPVVTVTRNYDEGYTILKQRIFLQEWPNNLTAEERDFVWWIPIVCMTLENLDNESVGSAKWMGERTATLPGFPRESFVILNPDNRAMYLVNYDKRNWGIISQHMQSAECKIPKATRTKLLRDAFLLSRGNQLNISTALSLTPTMCNETDPAVWVPILMELQFKILEDFEYMAVEGKLKMYIRRLLTPLMERYGGENPYTENSSYEHTRMVYLVRYVLQSVGYQPQIDGIFAQLNKTFPSLPLLDNESGLTIYCPEFMTNLSGDWKTQLKLLLAQQNPFIRRTLWKCPGFEELITKLMNTILDECPNSSDNIYFVGLLTGYPVALDMSRSFFMKNMDQLVERCNATKNELLVPDLKLYLKIRSEEEENNMKQFLDVHPALKYNLKFNLNVTENTMRLVKASQQAPSLEKWLDQTLPSFTC